MLLAFSSGSGIPARVSWISSTLLTRSSFQSKNSSSKRERAWLACSRVVSS